MAVKWVHPDNKNRICEINTQTGDTLYVHEPYEWENDEGPEGWYALSDIEGIFVYAETEDEIEELRDRFNATATDLAAESGNTP